MKFLTEKKYIAGACVLLLFVFGCRKKVLNEELNIDDPVPSIDAIYFAGGATTVFDASANAYSHVASNASAATSQMHAAGASLFFADFSEYGSNEPDGLGPLFIQTSCEGCHPNNGRSQPPMSEVDYDSGLLMRFSLAGAGEHGEPIPVPGYGTQLQTRAIAGQIPEGHFSFIYSNEVVTYADGQSVILQSPSHQITDPYLPLPNNILYSMRNASPLYGLGLLEAVPLEDILSRVDETDDDHDYISGKANFVWNEITQQVELGRFGWKSSHPSVAQQTAGAFTEDMGITSAGFFPIENGIGQSNCTIGFGSDPDVTAEVINQVSFYVSTLAVPAPRNQEDSIVMRGKQIFQDINCAACHTPQLQTGSHPIAELANQTIYPYTDMLIHDMGEVLADGRPDFDASTNEWRTAPLWGIGLTHTVNPNARFLHDGRAATLEEAILWHGGEAYWSIGYYKQLTAADRAALITFLESL
jgi:CxxC motif-containing protein (DUF1111 family)